MEALPTHRPNEPAHKPSNRDTEPSHPSAAVPWFRSTFGLASRRLCCCGPLCRRWIFGRWHGSGRSLGCCWHGGRICPGGIPIEPFGWWALGSGWRPCTGSACRIGPPVLVGLPCRSTSPSTCPCLSGLPESRSTRCTVPVMLAAPIIYTGLELARAYVLTGFTMASIAHTQCPWLI